MTTFNILCVDDDVEFLNTTVQRMEKRRINATAANSGKEAFEILSKNDIDVVVTDVRMPEMDGIKILRHIKEMYPLVEVVMLTGHACSDTARKSMEAGAFDYLIKPISMDELHYKLEDAYQIKALQEEKNRRLDLWPEQRASISRAKSGQLI